MNDIVLTNDEWLDNIQIIILILFFIFLTLIIVITMHNIGKHKDKEYFDVDEIKYSLKQKHYNINKVMEEKDEKIQNLNKEILKMKKCTYCKYNKETGTEEYSFFRCAECGDQKKKFEYKEGNKK